MALPKADAQQSTLPIRSTTTTSTSPSSNPLDTPDLTINQLTSSSFDAATYLNETLPSLTFSTTTKPQPDTVTLTELSSQTQSLLTQLNAQSARLSNQLTQLTDEILRSSGRLAYEVEILRGEAVGLSEVMTEVVKEDIAKFVPEGAMEVKPSEGQDGETTQDSTTTQKDSTTITSDPSYITQLRTLSQVRARLDEVISIFGSAMEWPLAPSDISVSSSFISVSAPEPDQTATSREEKGKEVAKKLRAEVADLLENSESPEEGVRLAEERVEALRVLALVWKGTAEEKARMKFVDGLAKPVEERKRALEAERQKAMQRQPGSVHRQASLRREDGSRRAESPAPREERGGLFRGLQRLRDEIYLE